MQREGQQVLAGALAEQQAPPERRPLEIERPQRLRGGEPPRHALRARPQGAQIHHRQDGRHHRPGDLHRLPPGVDHLAAQDLVPPRHPSEGGGEGGHVQRSGQAHHDRQVVGGVARLELIEEPEPLLRERERGGPLAHPGQEGGRRGARAPPAVDPRCQLGQAGGVKQVAEPELHAQGLAHPGDHPQGDEGVTAGGEEAIVRSDRRQPQRRAPDAGEQFLGGGEGAPGPARRRGVQRFRCRQPGAVELAVGEGRQGRDHHQVRGDHRRGEQRGKEAAELPAIDLRPALRHHISGKAAAGEPAGAGADHRHRLAHRRVAQQGRFHLAELNAHPPYLHLVVEAPQELDLAAGQPAAEVAGRVEALAGLAAERIGEELLRRQVGATAIAAGQADATGVELARHPRRQRAHLAVEQQEADVGERLADRGDAGPLWRFGPARPVGDVDRRLGGPVEVVRRHPRQEGQEALNHGERQGLAAAEQTPEGGARSEARLLQQQLQHRGYELQGGDPLLAHRRRQIGGFLVPSRTGEHHPAAGRPGGEDLPDRGVEAEGRLVQDPLGGVEGEGAAHPEYPVADRSVRHHHALRRAGGA
jgi:hypothetical protein